MEISDKQMKWIGATVVALAVLAVFFPVLRGEFLNWDDDGLFVENPYFRGLSPVHWQWMCTTFFFGHWQPLSWLSYVLDYMAWGMNPHGWHTTNLLLHTVNAILVYLLCLSFFKERKLHYAAAALAALFWAVHPLRVEVAAWLATRGYLLCTTFCILTVLFYLRAAREKRYPFTVLLCFTLATFTKGIGMMLPMVLLLIDWFPLRRITSMRTAAACVAGKLPFFALSLLTGITAFLAKQTNGGMASVERYGLVERLGQAVYGIWFYLLKTVWPLNLSPLYYKQPEAGPVMTALVLTAAVAIFFFLFRRKLRSLVVALGAFLLLIFPMLGLTQSGTQLFADRFMYLAAIPFSVLLTAGLVRLTFFRRTTYCVLAVLMVLFGIQSAVWSVSWQDSLSLWMRALAVDQKNPQAHNSVGLSLKNCGQYEKALEHFNSAVQLDPGYTLAWHNRSVALTLLGRYDEALAGWNTAFSLPGISAKERTKMLWVRGWVFEQTGNLDAAEKDYSSVADDREIDPVKRADILLLRAALYTRTGQEEKALADLATVLELPDPFGGQRQKAQSAIDKIKGKQQE